MTKNILVVLGSTRDGREGAKIANLAMKQLKAVGLEPILVDPLAIGAPVLRQAIHFLPPDQEAPEWMDTLHEQIKKADGLVLVSSEYNGTIPPALTNLLDHFPPVSYRHKPCSVVTYASGGWGGCRARVAMLPFITELGMVCLPSAVAIPGVENAGVDQDGGTEDEKILRGVAAVCEEMRWYAEALANQRDNAGGGYPN